MNFITLRRNINITSIAYYLYKQRALDTNIYNKLTDANIISSHKNHLLLIYLMKKGEEGYRLLVQALHWCGKKDHVQASLANNLEQLYYLECNNDSRKVNVVTSDCKISGQMYA